MNNCLLIISGVSLLIALCCWILLKFKSELYGILHTCILITLFITVISGVGFCVEKAIQSHTTSTSYYYDILEKKTYIETQLNKHKKEIEALRSGEVDGVVFDNKNEIVTLDKTIKKYNDIVLQHKKYKEDPLANKLCNENIANLNTFEEVFN